MQPRPVVQAITTQVIHWLLLQVARYMYQVNDEKFPYAASVAAGAPLSQRSMAERRPVPRTVS